VPGAIHYHFRQSFTVSARKAFEWCTDYTPGDHELMGEKNVERKISHFTDDTIILTDTFQTSTAKVEKQKLVQLYPKQMFWTSTHLTGPAKYSQFLYQITPEGDNASHLDFTGLFVDHRKEKLTNAEAEMLAEKFCKEDSDGWKLLSKAMTKELSK